MRAVEMREHELRRATARQDIQTRRQDVLEDGPVTTAHGIGRTALHLLLPSLLPKEQQVREVVVEF